MQYAGSAQGAGHVKSRALTYKRGDTFERMAGYCQKDEGQQHYVLHHEGVPDAVLKHGRELYEVMGPNPQGDRTFIKKGNIMVLAQVCMHSTCRNIFTEVLQMHRNSIAVSRALKKLFWASRSRSLWRTFLPTGFLQQLPLGRAGSAAPHPGVGHQESGVEHDSLQTVLSARALVHPATGPRHVVGQGAGDVALVHCP